MIQVHKAKREAEESKLRFDLENRVSKLEGYAEHMEHKAGSRFRPDEDGGSPCLDLHSDNERYQIASQTISMIYTSS
jgi:hypothetical protein